jgi:hypothetical protein
MRFSSMGLIALFPNTNRYFWGSHEHRSHASKDVYTIGYKPRDAKNRTGSQVLQPTDFKLLVLRDYESKITEPAGVSGVF